MHLSVFWVRAETYSSFINDFCQILKLVKPNEPPATDHSVMAEKTRMFLESSVQDWLLVIDNADTFDDFVGDLGSEQSIGRFVPRRGRVLVTTRDPRFLGSFAPAANGLQVKTMDREEARNLLITSLPSHLTASLVESDVQVLLDMLGNLPLGVAQAAANIDDLQQTFAECVRAFDVKRNRMELMQLPFQDFQTFDPHTASQSIFVTWEMSFERLQETAPLSSTWINYMGIFHWRQIPKRLMMRMPEFEDLSPLKLQSVVKRLLHLSMIDAVEIEKDWVEYDVHPLMHERIFQRLSNTDAERYSLSVADILASFFPVIPWSDDEDKTDSARTIGQYLLPHTLRLIELIETLTIRSRACARLLQIVGDFLGKVGRPYLGSIVALKALEMAPYVYEAHDASIHYIRKYAIVSLVANAQYAEADVQCRHAMNTLDSPEFQLQHDEASLLLERNSILNEQYEALRGLHKYAEAEEAYKALDLVKTRLLSAGANEVKGVDSTWSRVIQMHNIANLKYLQGRNDEARSLNRESLELAGSIWDALPGQGTAKYDRSFLAMLNLKAHIISRSVIESAVTDKSADELSLEAQNIYMLVFRRSFFLFGIKDIDTWKAANHCVRAMFRRKDYRAAMSVLLLAGLAAKDVDMIFEGQKLETFAITSGHVQSLSSVPLVLRNAKIREKAAMIINLYDHLVQNKAAEPITRYKTPTELNNDACALIGRGHFQHAEAILKGLLGNPPTAVPTIEYYNLMIAIARQPGRRSEAYVFRGQHLDKIAPAEATYGDLPTRLQRDTEDLRTYEEAKNKIQRGELTFGDVWWTEHEEALERGELRYGALFDDVPYGDDESDDEVGDVSTQMGHEIGPNSNAP